MTIFDTVLLPGRSRAGIRPGRIVAAGVVAWAIALAPMLAQAADKESKQAETQKDREAPKASSTNPEDKGPNDLESCKRDADGMKGPERSRFMTSCIKARK
jgi:hypothetical protein